MTRTMSLRNRIFVVLFVLGLVWAAAHRQWPMVIIVGAGLAWAAVAIARAHTDDGTDVARLDAAEPADERERLLSDRALAVVGLVAVCLDLGILMWRAGAGYSDTWGADWRLPLLCLVWFATNRVVVRRGH